MSPLLQVLLNFFILSRPRLPSPSSILHQQKPQHKNGRTIQRKEDPPPNNSLQTNTLHIRPRPPPRLGPQPAPPLPLHIQPRKRPSIHSPRRRTSATQPTAEHMSDPEHARWRIVKFAWDRDAVTEGETAAAAEEGDDVESVCGEEGD